MCTAKGTSRVLEALQTNLNTIETVLVFLEDCLNFADDSIYFSVGTEFWDSHYNCVIT